MADFIVVAKVLLWVCGALLYLGAVWLISSMRLDPHTGLPFLIVGAGAFLLGSYYAGGSVIFVFLLTLISIFTALRFRAFGKR